MVNTASQINKNNLKESTERLKKITDDVFKHLNQEMDNLTADVLKAKLEQEYEK